MYLIERANYVREEIRKEFPDATKFIFEHLKEGYFRVCIDIGDKNAYLVADSNNDVKTIVAKLNESMDKPYNVFEHLNYICEVLPLMEPKHQDLDPKVVLENFKSFDALRTPEEKAEIDLEIKNTRANRVWLLENKKSFINTAQTKKFHELANGSRLLSTNNLPYLMLKAFNAAMME